MEHLGELVQMPSQKTDTTARLLLDERLDLFKFKHGRTYTLASLVMQVMGEPKPLFLLRTHNAATQIIPLGRALIDEVIRFPTGLRQCFGLLNVERRCCKRSWEGQLACYLAQCTN